MSGRRSTSSTSALAPPCLRGRKIEDSTFGKYTFPAPLSAARNGQPQPEPASATHGLLPRQVYSPSLDKRLDSNVSSGPPPGDALDTPSSVRSLSHPSHLTTWPPSVPPPRDRRRRTPGHCGCSDLCTHSRQGKSSMWARSQMTTNGTCDITGPAFLPSCFGSGHLTGCARLSGLSSKRLQ